MPMLSNMPGTGFPLWYGKFIPFTAFLKAEPVGATRSEITRSFELKASRIETELLDVCDSNGVLFDYSTPIAYTPQFGEQPPRFTVNGHMCNQATFTKTPLGEHVVDNNNQAITGPEANAGNAEPDANMNSLVASLKSLLESAIGLPVIRIQLAGYIFGFKGTHLP